MSVQETKAKVRTSELVPMPHGGAIHRGNAYLPIPGPGRPKKEVTEAKRRLEQEIQSQVEKRAAELIQTAIKQAESGSHAHLKELLDRVIGPVQTKVEVTLSGSFQDGMMACLAQLAPLLGANLNEAIERLKLLESDAKRAMALRDALDAEFTESE